MRLTQLFCVNCSRKMKVHHIIALVCIAAAAVSAKHVKVVGEIENHKFIDRQWVYAEAERHDELYKTFTFPEVS